MEMRATTAVEISEDVTPPLCPLACVLYSSHLSTHCSTCFSRLSSCSHHQSPLSPAELHLLSLSDSSDLRLALRLLRILRPCSSLSRIHGLLTNHENLKNEGENYTRVKEGAKVLSEARIVSGEKKIGGREGGDLLEEEEAVFCLVITNGVEVMIDGRALGIAVYDVNFSWINHSCSPNACYRFIDGASTILYSKSAFRIASSCRDEENNAEASLRNRLHSLHRLGTRKDSVLYSLMCLVSVMKGVEQCGPRIIVRSIKGIKKGEEVTVTYVDLLQPKAMRQEELWSKYCFVCCCERCCAQSPTYADNVLQEIFVDNADITNFSVEDVFEKITNYMDEAITEYLSHGNPESCCEKIETVLAQGFTDELVDVNGGLSTMTFRLHPLHYLSLNAYTTLASAYKARSFYVTGDLLESFNMSIANALYSLLLACATHHLFVNDEPSMITSATNFWTGAGESLIFLARSSAWNSLLETDLTSSHCLLPMLRCENCSLLNKFPNNLPDTKAQTTEFTDVSSTFLECSSAYMPQVWTFLVQGRSYLPVLMDLVDFSWFVVDPKSTSRKSIIDMDAGGIDDQPRVVAEGNGKDCEAQRFSQEERKALFLLGFHCLLYGGYLSTICYGPDNHITRNIQKTLSGD